MDNESEQKKRSQVEEQINLAKLSLEGLSSIVGELGQRLEKVLRAPTEPVTVLPANKEEEIVFMASEIRAIDEDIYSQARRIRDYINRLEL